MTPLQIYSFCDKDRPDLQGWWLQNHIPIRCHTCHAVTPGWVYVGHEKLNENHSQS